MTDVAVLIAAAGDGTRLGRGPKAFVTLRGRTLLDLCLESLTGTGVEVVVALPPGVAPDGEASPTPVTFVEGGQSRQETVARMLDSTRARVVLVHDVARPFLPRQVLERVTSAAVSAGAASAVLEVTDSMFDVRLSVSLPRSDLRIVQTPQGFARDLLAEAHAAARRDAVTATDDADLVRRLGHVVELVQGSRLLHKLTSPDDLAVMEALYEVWSNERTGSTGVA